MVKELVEFFAERRTTFPNMHVLSLTTTPSAPRWSADEGTETEPLLVARRDRALRDLYVVAKNAFHGHRVIRLKSLEHLTGFERHGHRTGAVRSSCTTTT